MESCQEEVSEQEAGSEGRSGETEEDMREPQGSEKMNKQATLLVPRDSITNFLSSKQA